MHASWHARLHVHTLKDTHTRSSSTSRMPVPWRNYCWVKWIAEVQSETRCWVPPIREGPECLIEIYTYWHIYIYINGWWCSTYIHKLKYCTPKTHETERMMKNLTYSKRLHKETNQTAAASKLNNAPSFGITEAGSMIGGYTQHVRQSKSPVLN